MVYLFLVSSKISYMGNIWWGKLWQTIQVKANGEEKFSE